ncbi:hypothetical protein HDU96_004943 [Phlyctochytrium bullatum]|nr:hypothetical protein HDU96_004943 [Phlyctochytrium bullatum]
MSKEEPGVPLGPGSPDVLDDATVPTSDDAPPPRPPSADEVPDEEDDALRGDGKADGGDGKTEAELREANEEEQGEKEGESGTQQPAADPNLDDSFTWWEKGMYQLYVMITTRNPSTGKSDFKWWERTEPIDAVDRDEFVKFTENVMIDLQVSYSLLGLAIDLYLLYVSYARAASCPAVSDHRFPLSPFSDNQAADDATSTFFMSTYITALKSFFLWRWFLRPIFYLVLFPLRWLLWLLIPGNTSVWALVGLCPSRPWGSPLVSFLHFTHVIQLAYYFVHLLGRLWPDLLPGTLERFATSHLLFIVNGAVFLPLYVIPSKLLGPSLASAAVARPQPGAAAIKRAAEAGAQIAESALEYAQEFAANPAKFAPVKAATAVAVSMASGALPKAMAEAVVSVTMQLNPAYVLGVCRNATNSTEPAEPSTNNTTRPCCGCGRAKNALHTPLLNPFPPMNEPVDASALHKASKKVLRRTIRPRFWGSWFFAHPRWGPVLAWWCFGVCHRVRWGILHWELQQRTAADDEHRNQRPPPDDEDDGHILGGGRSGLCLRLWQLFSPALLLVAFWWIGWGGVLGQSSSTVLVPGGGVWRAVPAVPVNAATPVLRGGRLVSAQEWEAASTRFEELFPAACMNGSATSGVNVTAGAGGMERHRAKDIVGIDEVASPHAGKASATATATSSTAARATTAQSSPTLIPSAPSVEKDGVPVIVKTIESGLWWRFPDVRLKGPSIFWSWLGVLVPSIGLVVWLNFLSFQHRAIHWGKYGGGPHTKTRGIIIEDSDGDLKIGVVH